MTDETLTGPKRARYSMRTLIVVTTIIALSITVAMLYREVGPLREELARLRNEVGELNIEDPTKLHAIRVDTNSELEWKWRIWIPEGASYRVHRKGGSVPKEGYPSGGGSMHLREPGEHVIRYLIRRDPRNGRWNGSLHTPIGSVGGDDHPWVEWLSIASAGSGVGSYTRSYETDEQVEIIRHRVSQVKDSADIEDPSAGFVVWLEPS